ncbi:MAG: hypothetical protein IJH63_10435 [Methanobrevibacter sp.]|nr:hypothetical protein [Methanosphaera sp.]MBR0371117.1 hypothetical protein [Methanobrevibacter sp.]
MISKEILRYGDYKVVVHETLDDTPNKNVLFYNDMPYLYFNDLTDCKLMCNVLSVYRGNINNLNESLNTVRGKLAFAEKLIEDLGGYTMRRQWREFNED